MTTTASLLILPVLEDAEDRSEKNLKWRSLADGKRRLMLVNLVKRIRYHSGVAIIKPTELKIIRIRNLMELESHSPLMKIHV
jgi:hypothetical protein